MKTKWKISKLMSFPSHTYNMGSSSLCLFKLKLLNRFQGANPSAIFFPTSTDSWIFYYEFFPLFLVYQLHQSEWHLSYQFIFVSRVLGVCIHISNIHISQNKLSFGGGRDFCIPTNYLPDGAIFQKEQKEKSQEFGTLFPS